MRSATTPTGNQLGGAASPYLRQHAGNPVDWMPWGEAAFARARALDRPIFLSIGYSTCHWCHVMARESFADPRTAALLNAAFVPVKVDREERRVSPGTAVVDQSCRKLLSAAGFPGDIDGGLAAGEFVDHLAYRRNGR